MSAGHARKPRTSGQAGRPLALTVFVLGVLALAPAAAHAGAQMGAGPTFPASVTVGQKGVSASVVLEHTSTGPEASQIATVCNAGECAGPSEGITITPSCGAINNVPTCTSPDPGVFSVAPVATLAPGSSCGLPPTQRFDVTVVDATSGKLRITPQGGAHVVLGPKGTPSAICEIQLTFDVVKQPAVDFFAAQTGIQTLQLVSADMTVNAVQGFGRGSSTGTTVEPPPPVAPPPPPPPAAGPVVPSSTGTASIAGQTGCATKNFNVQVDGTQISRVVFSLDGKRIRTLRKPNAGTSKFRVRVFPGTLSRGIHRVIATTTFTTDSNTPARRLRVVFSRCARAAQAPRFTG
ncbi:MAG: hypothetical protein QOK16_4550 [Solirubrobacteraceae bacterium]|nr:hypothetical protein [Solirubrobacteraceae bacterium]